MKELFFLDKPWDSNPNPLYSHNHIGFQLWLLRVVWETLGYWWDDHNKCDDGV
jgi:hypothetical protein